MAATDKTEAVALTQRLRLKHEDLMAEVAKDEEFVSLIDRMDTLDFIELLAEITLMLTVKHRLDRGA